MKILVKMTALFYIAILFLGTSIMAEKSAGPNCEKIQDEKAKRTCYKNEFLKNDKELNRVYKELQKSLTPEKGEEMKKDSLDWISYKDNHCKEIQSLNNFTEAEYYSCISGITFERTRFLKEAFGGEGVNNKIEGSYSDSYNGLVNITRTGKKYNFLIQVTRGPTFHSGELSGNIVMNGNKGVFLDKTEEGSEPCVLDFEFSERRIIIKETNCSLYHGVRAYFDGKYYKIKDIKLKQAN